MSDRMALAAQASVRCWSGPAVVAIVGCDDIEAAAAAGLTTVRQQPRLKRELAVRALLDGEHPAPLPVELVVRQT
jgi:DNA-binding LacI/PurR family transcriptional regulator